MAAALWMLLIPVLSAQQVRWKAGELGVTIAPDGYYRSIKVNRTEVLLNKNEYPVVSALDWKNEVMEPKAVAMDHDTLVCQMEDGEVVRLLVVLRNNYITMAVVACPSQYKVLVFGPVGVRMNGMVGETIGVVQHGDLALGMQGLNTKTIAGIPREAQEAYSARFYYSRNDSLIDQRHYYAAVDCVDGAVLQLSCRNRNPQSAQGSEVRRIGTCHAALAPCVTDGDGTLTGAAVALFGCRQTQLLDVVDRIEKEQLLPSSGHRVSSEPYLIAPYSSQHIDAVLDRCVQGGWHRWFDLPTVRLESHDGWLPERDSLVAMIAQTAATKGVSLGMGAMVDKIALKSVGEHTLLLDHLAPQLQFYLIESVGPDDTTLLVRTGMYSCFAQDMPVNMIRIGDELISYRSAADTVGYVTLRGCRRGVVGNAAAYARNTRGLRLWTADSSCAFYADLRLQDSMASALSALTRGGVQHLHFCDMEACSYTGQDEYAKARLIERCWHKSSQEAALSVDSLFHYGWHAATLLNEHPVVPGNRWETALKEHMDYCHRNLQPRTIGTVSISCATELAPATTMEDWEYALSKSAAYDAGYGVYCTGETMERHGEIDGMLATARLWDSLRTAGVFAPEVKKQMQHGYWHLERQQDGGCNLYPLHMSERMSVESLRTDSSAWMCEESGELQFRLRVTQGCVVCPVLVMADERVQFDCSMSAGECLVMTADGTATITDANGHKVKRVAYRGRLLRQEAGNVVRLMFERLEGAVEVQYAVRGSGIAIP